VKPIAEAGPRRIREVVTPEGVALPFEIASVFDRAAAVLVDLIIIHVGVFLIIILAFALAGFGFGAHAFALGLLASFLLRSFYFSFFEIRGGGATPGKRRMNIRVISRDGGVLTAESVLARNLTREFEIFLPLALLGAPSALMFSFPTGAALLGGVWLLVGALTPLFNRDRLRLGDLLGGTIVVMMPRTVLLEDPAIGPPPRAVAEPKHGFVFATEHLEQYGIDELQVLEGLVRRAASPGDREVREAVAKKIQEKIAWEPEVPADQVTEFLRDFYRQLRAHLEHKAAFGVRQQKKKAGKLKRESRGTLAEPTAEPSTRDEIASHGEDADDHDGSGGGEAPPA